ncbi:MAG TPA: MerR family DNA-binding transcriptional regulator [Solirubrobacteraceae bacterium]|nr:MerR family DNA-binding transcriptional regulator [Solirubrobacteraceae bacterium]
MTDTPPDTPAIDELVKIGTAASALGVSADTLRRWERAGKIRFQRRDNQRYLSAADLSKLLSDRSAKGLTSTRNRMQGIVVAVKRDEVMAQIDMICGHTGSSRSCRERPPMSWGSSRAPRRPPSSRRRP